MSFGFWPQYNSIPNAIYEHGLPNNWKRQFKCELERLRRFDSGTVWDDVISHKYEGNEDSAQLSLLVRHSCRSFYRLPLIGHYINTTKSVAQLRSQDTSTMGITRAGCHFVKEKCRIFVDEKGRTEWHDHMHMDKMNQSDDVPAPISDVPVLRQEPVGLLCITRDYTEGYYLSPIEKDKTFLLILSEK